MEDDRLHLEILPRAQRRLWDELDQVPGAFVLYGGTAIALRLGHRHSVDFGFFTFNNIVPRTLQGELRFLADAEVLQLAPNTLTVTVDEL